MISRRKFLQSSAGGLSAALFCGEKAFSSPDSDTQFVALLSSNSFLKIFDVSRMRMVHSSKLDMASGHSVIRARHELVCVSQYANSCLILDERYQLRDKILAPEGQFFHGHGYFDPKRNFLFLASALNESSGLPKGELIVVDMLTRKQIARIDSGGLLPHDILELPGNDQIVVAHYGTTSAAPSRELYHFDAIKPSITVISLSEGKVVRDYPCKVNAAITHLAVTSSNQIFGVPLQGVKKTDDGKRIFYESLEIRSVGLNEIETKEQILSLPMPLLRIKDPHSVSLEVEAKMFDLKLQKRPQSVASSGDLVCATFTTSDSILIYDARTEKANFISGEACGVKWPRGVAAVGVEGKFAVSGDASNIALISGRDNRADGLVASEENHSASHISVI